MKSGGWREEENFRAERGQPTSNAKSRDFFSFSATFLNQQATWWDGIDMSEKSLICSTDQHHHRWERCGDEAEKSEKVGEIYLSAYD